MAPIHIMYDDSNFQQNPIGEQFIEKLKRIILSGCGNTMKEILDKSSGFSQSTVYNSWSNRRATSVKCVELQLAVAK